MKTMASPFSRTIRSLKAESSRLSTAALIAAAALLGGWLLWFVMARVAIYETSETARLEVDGAAHPIEAAVAGRVVKTNLAIGREVRAGEALVELESDAQRFCWRMRGDSQRGRPAACERAWIRVRRNASANRNVRRARRSPRGCRRPSKR